MSKNEAVVSVNKLTKSFRIPLEGNQNLKQKIVNVFKRKRGYRDFSPLKGISFEINDGEFFGIVGRNGSGKSTLLKTIAGIYSPDKGSVSVNGLLVPFIELGVGFNPDLSGRENVYLNSALLGFSREETDSMYDDIVDFAELHDFMEEKLKNYSSGMQVRLAFSIAIRARGDILLLDEVLAVGDSAFQQKCLNYFTQLKREKKTVILVSHGMSSIERFCDRALLLEEGKIVKIGSSVEVAELYEELFLDDANKKTAQSSNTVNNKLSLKASIIQEGISVNAVRAKKPFTIAVSIKSSVKVSSANVGINIRDDQKRVVFSTDSRMNIGEIKLDKGGDRLIELSLDNYYTNGNYTVDVHVVNEDSTTDKVLIRSTGLASFSVNGIINHAHSMFHPDFKVEVK